MNTESRIVKIGDVAVGGGSPMVLIAGPCVIEQKDRTYACARKLKEIARKAGFPLVFKASYDKANRTSLHSYRGPGLEKGLAVLSYIKNNLNVPVLSDVHRFEEITPAAGVLDIMQIPAFLCRQTDFILEAARTGLPVNVKKGQFLSPQDMQFVAEKICSTGNDDLLLTERGTTFGYGNLVVDMRGLIIMKQFGHPIVFDATHSVQLPGGSQGCSGGDRRFVAPLARAAAAVGIDALFLEVHENPDAAFCDGPNSLPLSELEELLCQIRTVTQWSVCTHGPGKGQMG